MIEINESNDTITSLKILKFFDETAGAGGRRNCLVVSAPVFGASGPGSCPGRGHCIVFLGKTLYSHSASLHPAV